MNCELKWTADRTLDYVIATLSLPWQKELPELGMRWSFRYSLVFEGRSVPLRKRLEEAGIGVGGTVQLSISGSYEDLYEQEIGQMWEPGKIYDLTSMRRHEIEGRKKIEERGPLSGERLRQIANSCFAHV
jgi:intein/homing endonuclease